MNRTTEATVRTHAPAKLSIGARVVAELREFAVLAAYLYVCFAAIVYYKAAILHDEGISFAPWMIAFVKALIAAKFMLLGRAFGLAEGFTSYPLVVPTLIKSVAFSVLLVVMMIGEEAIVGYLHGRTFAQSMAELAGGARDQQIATIALSLLILVPYFAFRSLGDVLGERNLVRVFFNRRGRTDA
jgi:hypothetical protein